LCDGERGLPIQPYPYPGPPPALRPWNPAAPAAAARVIELVNSRLPNTRMEHVGSTSVPGCDGKGTLDFVIPYRDQAHLDAINEVLFALGCGRQRGKEPFPESRPMRHGSFAHEGETFLLHIHVVPSGSNDEAELCDFRDQLLADPKLVDRYVALKRAIMAAGPADSLVYTKAKRQFFVDLGFPPVEDDPAAAKPPLPGEATEDR
jgi:GrpB-like predicted nucleotidyltransferase (UPF0157 family)